ncbi:J domain-containing protein, partial [uncultured Clostridium sp.]
GGMFHGKSSGGSSRSRHFTGGSSFGGSSAHFGGGSGFGGFGGSQGFHSADFREKGSDLTSDVTISFDEAVSGCEKLITLQNPQTGKRQSLQVHIPAGIDTGKSIRLKGKGMPGTGGGEAGDLLLNITVTAKPGWERNEMDVYSTVRIPFTTAVFGGEALVSTLYGNVLCKIAAGTQSGTKIKLKGKGIVSMKNPSIHGNQYVTVQIDVPNHLTPEAEQKLREFEHACGLNKNSQGGPNGRSAA